MLHRLFDLYFDNEIYGFSKVYEPTENLDFFDAETDECTDSYVQYISEEINRYTDPVVMVEQRLDFSKCVPNEFSTGDCVIVADEVLTVIYYKHGKGMAVDADHNPKMMLYALGAIAYTTLKR